MDKISLSSFLHSAFIGFVALIPPINPLGSTLIVEPYIMGLSQARRFKAALTIATYSFILCTAVAMFGGFFFHFFGISIPVVQLAGGFLICKMGFDSLSSGLPTREATVAATDEIESSKKIEQTLFFPLSFPITTGGGTISVLLALSANNFGVGIDGHLFEQTALILASFIMCSLVCICYYYGPSLLNHLSGQGRQVVDRLSGFLTFCVGLQIFVNGFLALMKANH
jgi:multiple antibiotic resistance protein